MKQHAIKLVIGAVVALSAGACISGEDAQDVQTSDLAANNGLGANALGANALGANALGANALGANALGANALGANSMIETADGRAVLSYIVGCALSSSQSVTATDSNGNSYTFTGAIGLAPAWATRAPTVSERRWVSACVLARTNLYGKQVFISLRHDSNLALVSTAAERAQYTNAEGAFYGDLFASPQTYYACSNRSWTPYAPDSLRMCALSSNGTTTDCGFMYAGACNKKCTDTTAPFGSCLGGTTRYAEVITIFLTSSQQQGSLQ